MTPLVMFQLVAIFLFFIGLVGILRRKSLVGMLICVELMLNGAGLAIVSAGQLTQASATLGQLTTLIVMGLAAAEATLVLTIILVVVKRFGSGASDVISEMKG